MSWAKGQEKQLFCFSSPKKDLIQKQSVIVGGILYSISRRCWQKQIFPHIFLFACELQTDDSNGCRTHMDPTHMTRQLYWGEKRRQNDPPAHSASRSSIGTNGCVCDSKRGDSSCVLFLTIAAYAPSMWFPNPQQHMNTNKKVPHTESNIF